MAPAPFQPHVTFTVGGWLVSEKALRRELPARAPEGQQGAQDFALGVEPRVDVAAGARQGLLVKFMNGAAAEAHRRQPRAVADGFERAVAVVVGPSGQREVPGRQTGTVRRLPLGGPDLTTYTVPKPGAPGVVFARTQPRPACAVRRPTRTTFQSTRRRGTT